MKTTKEMIDIMSAWNGKENEESNIETRYLNDSKKHRWKSCTPSWDWGSFDYRIKEDSESIMRDIINKLWNGKSGHDSNIIFSINTGIFKFYFPDNFNLINFSKNKFFININDVLTEIKFPRNEEFERRMTIEKAWNGKKGIECNIQYDFNDDNKCWSNYNNDGCPSWNWIDFNYRIKPEAKYEPYTWKECIELVGKTIKNDDHSYIIISVEREKIFTWDGYLYPDDLFKNYTFLDGTSCGKLIK